MKRQLLVVLALMMACVLLASCGQSSGGSSSKGSGNASASTSVASSSSTSTAKESAGKDTSAEASKGTLTQEFEFTKSVMNQKLEKPIIACGLKFDESDDLKSEDNLNQERDSFHLHISILETGYDTDKHFTKCQSDNAEYAKSIARGHNVQQADATSKDGSAKFTVIRYTSFEDGEENDYKYMADLVYTDGANAASTEFMYSIDKEYGNGEEVEAEMKAITKYYGIDYGALNWVNMESQSK